MPFQEGPRRLGDLDRADKVALAGASTSDMEAGGIATS